MRDTPGVLFLDDLHAFAPWSGQRAPSWAERAGLRGSLLPPTIEPPRSLVVVVRSFTWSLLQISVGWLRLARRLALVIDEAEEPELATDPELRELAELERQEIRNALGNVRATIAVSGALDAAIEQALEAVRGDPHAWTTWTAEPARAAAPPGPWLEWSPPGGGGDGALRLDDCLRHLAPQLCAPGGRPALLDVAAGARVDLGSGERTPVARLESMKDEWHPCAATVDGERWLRAGPAPRTGVPRSWSLDGAAPTDPMPGAWGRPIGIDPSQRLAWAGDRCFFHWYALTEWGPACWTPSSHGWPDGHAKKLLGYKSNEPLWVQVAPDASACLSVYEHDALLTPGLPLRWRDVGPFALAERAAGEPRALFFQRSDSEDAFPGDPERGDEDARDRLATVALGPSDALRYVVGLEAPTWRLRGERGERLGGAEPGYLAFDAAHRVVRRGAGRLLAGWDRWIVVQRGERLVREELTSGAVEDLGPAGRAVTAAVALAGSPNVVLLSLEAHAAWVRVV
ncbi:MAG: hypothetical protein SangKO_033570 [Sandaracinaceae bacterium]